MTFSISDFHIYVNIYINTKFADRTISLLSFLDVLLARRREEKRREVLL